MAKSKARFLSELLGSTGLVKKSKSALAGADEVLDLDVIPSIPNSKLTNSSISIAGHSTALGSSVSLNTGNITEHTNYKYFTEARARGSVSVSGDLAYNSTSGVISFTERTDAEVRGLVSAGGNLSYNSSTGVFSFTERTDAEVRGLVSASGNLSYNSSTGAFSYTTPTTIASLSNHDTADLAEGTNLYFTNARARSAISATGSLSYNSTTGVMSFTMPAQNTSNITEGSNLYYTNARADARIAAASTSDLSEGTNLYYTDARADARVALIVDSAPGTLNTLNELAAALGDDANFSTTVTNSIATKLPLAGGALTGAVTTNSTFDGRNVSVDGAKLDGIEAGATADQTAAQILTAIKTVDGSGSGLDADLLDGLQSDIYFKSYTNNNGGWSASNRNFSVRSGGTAVGLHMEESDGTFGFQLYGDGSDYGFLASEWGSWDIRKNPGGRLYTNNTTTYYLQPNSTSNLNALNIGGSGVWHSGNDGSGSGLDADLLDGQQGSYYTTAANLTGDFPSFVQIGDSASYGTNNGSWGARLNVTDNVHAKIEVGQDANSMLSHWYAHTGQDSIKFGTSSAHDVEFQRGGTTRLELTSDSITFSGSINMNGHNIRRGNHHTGHLEGSYNNIGGNGTKSNPIYTIGSSYNPGDAALSNMYGIGYTDTSASFISFTGAASWGMYVAADGDARVWLGGSNGVVSSTGQHYVGSNVVWNAGNDGSGSGLDADTVDGIQASSFLRSDAEDTTSGSLIIAEDWGSGTHNSAFVIQGSHPSWETRGTSAQPYGWLHHQDSSGNYTLYNIAGYTGNNWTQRFTFQTNGTFRNGGTSGNVYYHQGNDGSGSGLDADTVDGIQASSFLRSDADDVMTGELNINSNTGVTGSTAPSYTSAKLEVQTSNNHVPAIAFHRGGYSATALYEYDGELYTNAWTSRAQTGKLISSGNLLSYMTSVDGSGSGLDADLLDGKDHTNFGATLATYGTTGGASGRIRCTAPFNTNSSHMFQVTVSLYSSYTCHTYIVSGYMYSTQNQWYASKAIYTGTGNPDIVVGRDSSGKAYISIANGDYTGVRVHNMTRGYQTSVADTYDPWTITVNGATENSVTPTVSKVWHSTNDGSGSGLDADLLDGYHASTTVNAANTVPIRDTNGYLNLGYINTNVGLEALTHDWNRVYASTDGYIRPYSKSNFKIRMGLTKNEYDRVDYTSNTHYHTGANSHNDVTFNGLLERGCGFIDNWNSGAGKPPTGSHFNGFQALHYSSSAQYHHGMQLVMSAGNPSNTYLRGWWANGGSGYAWQKIWTDGNDGSGSGLDADLLDGINSTYFNRGTNVYGVFPGSSGHNLNDVFTSSSYNRAGFIDAWSGSNFPPSTTHIQGIQVRHNAASHYGWQLFGQYNQQGKLFHRQVSNGTWGSWSELWNSNNDGSGSGLDADTVDGIQGASLLRSDAADTFTGTLTMGTQQALVANNYGRGVFGLYSSYRYQHVWSMGTAYKTNDAGTSYGNMYGLTYTHTNVGTGANQAIAGLSHQLQGRANGTLWWSLGNGIWTVGNITAYSDIAVKTNLVRIPNALEKVCSINGYTYERTDYVKDPEDKNAPDILRQAGVVAQEIEKVLPEVVSGKEGNKAVAYGNIVALLIESIKELKDEVDDLKQQLKEK